MHWREACEAIQPSQLSEGYGLKQSKFASDNMSRPRAASTQHRLVRISVYAAKKSPAYATLNTECAKHLNRLCKKVGLQESCCDARPA